MTSSADDGLTAASTAALRHLHSLGSALSLDEAIRITDKAIRASYSSRTALAAKALLCFKGGYRIAGGRAVALLEEASPDPEPSVVNAILRAAGRSGLAGYKSKMLHNLLERHQEDLKRAKEAFSSCLKEEDARLQGYRAGSIKLAEFMKLIFPDRGNLPTAVASWYRALYLENSIDFKQVEQERSTIIELLVAAMSKDDIEQLVFKSGGFRMGVLTYGSFYEYLAEKIGEYRVDLTDLREFARYADYIASAQGTDPVAFHGEVWDATWRRFVECHPSPAEWLLLREAENAYCLGRLLNVLEGKPPERIQGTYAPNATALQALADKSDEGAGTRRRTGGNGWLSRLLRGRRRD